MEPNQDKQDKQTYSISEAERLTHLTNKLKAEAKAAYKAYEADRMSKVNANPAPNNILKAAHDIVHGDREQTYGDPTINLRNIAAYWSIHLSAINKQQITLTPADVCVMMMSLKLARLANTPNHRDSVVDIAGYAALLDRSSKLV